MTDAATPAPSRRRQRLGRLLRAITLLAVLLALVEPSLVIALLVTPGRGDAPPSQELLAHALPRGGLEQVDFPTGDGLVLRGDLMGSLERPVVVFGHGYRHRRRQGDPLARTLLERGYCVLSFDFRGCGDSDGVLTGVGAREEADVRAALRFLRARGVEPERTAYVGFSMGAAAALRADDVVSTLAAVVLIAPYNRFLEAFERRTTHFGVPLRPWFTPAVRMVGWALEVDPASVRPIDHAASIAPAPLLLIGAKDDWRVPPRELEELYGAAREPKRLEILPGGDHLHLARLGGDTRAPIVHFLEEHLPPLE